MCGVWCLSGVSEFVVCVWCVCEVWVYVCLCVGGWVCVGVCGVCGGVSVFVLCGVCVWCVCV